MRVPIKVSRACSQAPRGNPIWLRKSVNRSDAVCCKTGSCSFTCSTYIDEPEVRSRGRIRSLVSMRRPPWMVSSLYFALFNGVPDQHFDQRGLQLLFLAQDTPQSLH